MALLVSVFIGAPRVLVLISHIFWKFLGQWKYHDTCDTNVADAAGVVRRESHRTTGFYSKRQPI